MASYRTIAILTVMASTFLLHSTGVQAQAVVKRIQPDKLPIAGGVWVDNTFYLSGQLASPMNQPTTAGALPSTSGSPSDYGDTKTQSASVLLKIQKLLQDQGLELKDIVKMTIFLAPDPKTGKMDFSGMQSEYLKLFGTKDQPNKPARSAVQVAALATPWALVEIEVIAVRSK